MPKTGESPLAFSTLKVGANLLGMTHQGFSELVKKDEFPAKGADGMWQAADVVAWYIAFKTASPDYEKARARKTAADAERVELVVAQRKRELVPVSEVEREWSRQVTRLREVVEKGFHTLAPKLSGHDAPGILIELQKWWKKAQRTIAE